MSSLQFNKDIERWANYRAISNINLNGYTIYNGNIDVSGVITEEISNGTLTNGTNYISTTATDANFRVINTNPAYNPSIELIRGDVSYGADEYYDWSIKNRSGELVFECASDTSNATPMTISNNIVNISNCNIDTLLTTKQIKVGEQIDQPSIISVNNGFTDLYLGWQNYTTDPQYYIINGNVAGSVNSGLLITGTSAVAGVLDAGPAIAIYSTGNGFVSPSYMAGKRGISVPWCQTTVQSFHASTTASTSTATGCAIFAGGIGLSGNVFSGGYFAGGNNSISSVLSAGSHTLSITNNVISPSLSHKIVCADAGIYDISYRLSAEACARNPLINIIIVRNPLSTITVDMIGYSESGGSGSIWYNQGSPYSSTSSTGQSYTTALQTYSIIEIICSGTTAFSYLKETSA